MTSQLLTAATFTLCLATATACRTNGAGTSPAARASASSTSDPVSVVRGSDEDVRRAMEAEGAPAPNGDDLLVRATGGTKSRALRDRFADSVNVKDYGAIGDGEHDDTTAVAAAYGAVVRRGGGTLAFPSGTYRFNLVVAASNIRIAGDGTSSGATGAGTVFRPAVPAKPLLQFGNGVAPIENLTLENVTLVGDAATPTGDGLFVIGAHYVYVTRAGFLRFGRDNISLTSSSAQPTYFTQFVQVHSQYAARDALRIDVGGSWLTSVYFTNCTFWGGGAPQSRVATVIGTRLSTANCWLEASGSGKGVLLAYDATTHSQMPSWSGAFSTTLDSTSTDDVLIEIDNTGTSTAGRRLSTIFVRGVAADGKLRWSANGSTVDLTDTNGPGLLDRTSEMTVLHYLGFARYASTKNDEPSRPDIRLEGDGQVGDEHLTIAQAQARVGRVASFVGVPPTSTSPGNPGEWAADSAYVYVCFARNRWRRISASSW